jgi:hypothetical protein
LLAIGALAPIVARAAPGDPQPSLAKPSAQPPAVVSRWLTQHTGMAPGAVVSVGDEYIVAVLSSRPLDPAKPDLLRLEIRAEMTDPDAETAGLLRSLSATLDINCADHTSHFVEVRTFAGVNLTGAEQVSHPAEGWVADPRGSYFEDVHTAACTPNAPRPLMAAPGAPASRPAPEPSPERTLSALLRPEQAPDAPPPARTPATRRLPDRAVAARPGGTAQIAAALSQAKAEAALADLRAAQPALMDGVSIRIERIDRGGVAYFRALVSSFKPPMGAAGFCRRLTAAGHACIIR